MLDRYQTLLSSRTCATTRWYDRGIGPGRFGIQSSDSTFPVILQHVRTMNAITGRDLHSVDHFSPDHEPFLLLKHGNSPAYPTKSVNVEPKCVRT